MKLFSLRHTALGLALLLLCGCASVFVPEPGFLNEGSTYRFSNLGLVTVLEIGDDGWVKLEKAVGQDQKIEYWYNTASGVYVERAPEAMIEQQ